MYGLVLAFLDDSVEETGLLAVAFATAKYKFSVSLCVGALLVWMDLPVLAVFIFDIISAKDK